jgi:hypothetical protein
VNVVIHL